jgi:hypothetical protein
MSHFLLSSVWSIILLPRGHKGNVRCIHCDGVDGIASTLNVVIEEKDIDGVRAGTETWQINKAPLL